MVINEIGDEKVWILRNTETGKSLLRQWRGNAVYACFSSKEDAANCLKSVPEHLRAGYAPSHEPLQLVLANSSADDALGAAVFDKNGSIILKFTRGIHL